MLVYSAAFFSGIASNVVTTQYFNVHRFFKRINFVLTAMNMTLDRFLAIYLHIRYREVMTHQRITIVVISLWVFSLSLSLVAWWCLLSITALIFAIFEVGYLVITTFLNHKLSLPVGRRINEINALH